MTVWGCATPPPGPPAGTRATIRDALESGDSWTPRRAASLRMLESALRADEEGAYSSAQSRYERAIQIDVYNPYAYLALARFALQGGDLLRANDQLDQAEHLFRSEIQESRANADAATAELLERSQVDLSGLRGALLSMSGRDFDAAPLLDTARREAPDVWGDGFLSASELR